MGNTVLAVELAGPATEAEALLASAARAWRDVRARYRDGCLEVGRLLCKYVVSRVAEGDAVPEAARLEQHLTRQRAVEDAAERLDMTPGRCGQLIRVASAVDVLSDGGDVGRLSYQALYALAVLAERRRGIARGVTPGPGEIFPSDGEEWVPKDPERSPRVFRQAVRENWSAERCRAQVTREGVQRRGRQVAEARRGDRGLAAERQKAAATPLHVARSATPKDLADLIAEMLLASRAPAEVAAALCRRADVAALLGG